MATWDVALYALLATIAACALVLGYLLVGRVLLARRRARVAARQAAYRRALILAALEVGEVKLEIPRPSSSDFLIFINAATRLFLRLRGESRDQLADFLIARGVDETARGQLRRRHSRLRLITCAQFLGALADQQALPGLLELMNDRRWEVRLMGARSIGRLHVVEGTPALLESVARRDPLPVTTVAAAAVQLSTSGATALIPGTEAASASTRTVAVLALGQLRARDGLDPLIEVLRNDPNAELRGLAATAVGRIGTRTAVDALIDTVINEGNPTIKSSACQALGENPSLEALAVLYAEISDPNADVARSAATALSYAGDRGVALLERLSDDSEAAGSDYATEAIAESQVRAQRTSGWR